MKFKATVIVFYAAIALTRATEPSPPELEQLEITPVEDNLDGFITLDKRRGCSGNRLNYEVCQGGFIARMNSYHNWYAGERTEMANLLTAIGFSYRAGGHCCARNSNRDYGITISNSMQSREDCGYCFSGNCKAEKH